MTTAFIFAIIWLIAVIILIMFLGSCKILKEKDDKKVEYEQQKNIDKIKERKEVSYEKRK